MGLTCSHGSCRTIFQPNFQKTSLPSSLLSPASPAQCIISISAEPSSTLPCLLLKAWLKWGPVPRESLSRKKRNGSYPNWKERLAGDHVSNSSYCFSWSLEALKRKSIFYLNIFVISHLIFEQLSIPTNEVLMKAMDPVFWTPLQSDSWQWLEQQSPYQLQVRGLSPRATEDAKGAAQFLTHMFYILNCPHSWKFPFQTALMDNAPDWDATIIINSKTLVHTKLLLGTNYNLRLKK